MYVVHGGNITAFSPNSRPILDFSAPCRISYIAQPFGQAVRLSTTACAPRRRSLSDYLFLALMDNEHNAHNHFTSAIKPVIHPAHAALAQ